MRRGLTPRGGAFYIREYVLTMILLFTVACIIAAAWIPVLINIKQLPIHIALAFLAFTTLVSLALILPTLNKTLPLLSACPTWLFAEQLNPELLLVHQLLKPSTTINLKHSKINATSKFKHFRTIEIVDRETKSTATLSHLTPNEYNRFTQYWNAANPPANTEDHK